MKRLAFLPLFLLASCAHAAGLTAGPMIGHVTDRSVRLWMQFPVAGAVTVTAYEVTRNQSVSGLKFDISGPTPFVCDVPINNLLPNNSYRIEVKLDGEPVKIPGPELVVRTAPIPGEEATFSVAFGNGLAFAPLPPASIAATQIAPVLTPHNLPIFRAIDDTKPRAFFFLGNSGLLPAKLDDFPATHRAAYRYLADFQSLVRREPDLQPLFRSTPCYAIYGERDFGPVGSDASFVFAPESILAFQRFWPNPDWGTPESPGCFSTFTFGDVDFFLLDARTFRTDKSFLGAAQLAWLQKNLAASKAAFKVLGAPCTLWGDNPQSPDADSWSRFPDEQQSFLRWLGQHQIDGIVAIAGNQAAGQFTKFTPDPALGLRYPLISLGTSALASPAASPQHLPDNPNRLGVPVAEDTFGTLDFIGTREHRTLTLRLHDATGKTRVEQVLPATILHN